jgi:large subunit ribosomal protein L10
MARPDKAAAVAEIATKFRDSNAAVLTEYRGLTVAQMRELRSTIRDHASYAVVKNTLTAIAAKDAGVTAFDGQLSGPTAVAFVTGDPVEAAKGLRDFAKAHPALVIKSGVLDGRSLTADEVRTLADLESREVLLAKLAGAMKASLTNAVSLFAAPLSKTARVLDALRQKLESEEGNLTADAGAQAPDATSKSAPPVEETPDATAVEAPEATAVEGVAEDHPAEEATVAEAETTEG